MKFFCGLLADAVVLVHLLFIVFVVFGGLLVWRWRRVAWFHIPAALWGAAVELAGWVCPLTPLENRLRAAAGEGGYEGGFIDQLVTPVIYPSGLTRGFQIVLGLAVVTLNIAVYWGIFRRDRGPTK